MPQDKRRCFKKADIERLLNACIGKTLGEVDCAHVFRKTVTHTKVTGIAGDVIEQSVLGFPADNKQEADLCIDGMKTELKTTGIRQPRGKKGNGVDYEAKEPMSITAVSPDAIVKERFNDSMFWHKLAHLLLVYYLYDSQSAVKASQYADFLIKGYQFHEFGAEDVERLRNDWEIVRDFIRGLQRDYADYEKQYPRLSSELRKRLMLIDTAPKWPNHPRFRLKRSVVNSIVKEHFKKRIDCLPDRYTSYDEIIDKCARLSKEYKGKTIAWLVDHFGIEGRLDAKSIGERVIVRMFGGKALHMRQIELFNKIGMFGKTFTITKKKRRTEDIKLFRIDFDEVCGRKVTFEESLFNEFFSNHQILFTVFEEPSDVSELGENVFLGFKTFSFSDAFIKKDVFTVWKRVRERVINGSLRDVTTVSKKTGKPVINKITNMVKSAPNFPKSSEGTVFVRGGGTTSAGKTEAVRGIDMLPQWIWVRGDYIAAQLEKIDYLA